MHNLFPSLSSLKTTPLPIMTTQVNGRHNLKLTFEIIVIFAVPSELSCQV